MLPKWLQEENLLNLFGYLIYPLLMWVPLLASGDPINTNYTAMINSPLRSLFFFCTAFPYIYLASVLYDIRPVQISQKRWNIQNLLLLLLSLAVQIIPYHSNEDFLSGMHVAIGFLCFLLLNYELFQILLVYQKERMLYILFLLLAWFISLTYSSINGLAEIIYAVNVLYTVTTIKKRRTF